MYIEGLKDYVKVHLKGIEKQQCYRLPALRRWKKNCRRKRFMRVHGSFIVSLDKITSMTKNSLQIGKIYVTVGDQYKDAFRTVYREMDIGW